MTSDVALTYTLTADDLVRSWRQHFLARVLRSRWAFWTVLGAAAYLLGTVGVAIYCDDWTVVWLVVAVLAILPGIMAFNYFVVVPSSASRSDVCGLAFDVRITGNGISWRGGQIDANHSWARFIDVAEGRDYFLLYFSQITYFSVPKRAFSSQSVMDAFREIIANRKADVTLVRNAQPDEFAGQDGFVLRFRFTEAEQVMLLRYAILRGIGQSKPAFVLYGLFGVLASYGIAMMLTTRLEAAYIVMVAPALFALSGLASYYFFWAKKAVRKSPTYNRDQAILINDHEIVVDTGITRTGMAWSGFTAVSDKGGLVIILRGTDAPLALAKRGFASPEDEARFREMVKRHIPGG